MGRPWVSEAGNLYATLALRDPAPPECLATLSLAAAVAVRRALVNLTSAPERLALKWPNDVLLDARKASGLLLEGRGGGLVLVGCGVNCAHHPPNTTYGATDFAAAGLVVEPAALSRRLKDEMTNALSRWNRGSGFSDIRKEWLSAAYGMGRPATIMRADGPLEGIAQSIDMEGRLLLDVNGRTVAIAAGDMVPARAGRVGNG